MNTTAVLIDPQQGHKRLMAPLHAANGMWRHPLYHLWVTMHRRCSDSRRREFPNYGGRGIQVCARWLSFASFLSDMGDRPEGTTLDRRDNDGNYEPGNCQWSTIALQNANRSNCLLLELDGETKHASAWAAQAGISLQLLRYRMKTSGMDLRQAMTAPKFTNGSRHLK